MHETMKVEVIGYNFGTQLCARAAAICTNSKDWTKALKGALASGHESVLEHGVFTFKVTGVSRALLAQLSRHRIASFSVQSQRYVNMDDAVVVIPPDILTGICADADNPLYDRTLALIDESKAIYKELLKAGYKKEDARYFLLEGTETALIFTMNIRELRHFFSLRCCNRAQWEIRNMANEMLRQCRQYAPLLLADAGPGCVRGKCPEAKPCGHPVTPCKEA